jgi:hypothetical protein
MNNFIFILSPIYLSVFLMCKVHVFVSVVLD